MAKYIHVANLPVKAEPGDLEQRCGEHGEVLSIKMRPGQARIEMASGAEAAAKALQAQAPADRPLEIVIHHEEQWEGL